MIHIHVDHGIDGHSGLLRYAARRGTPSRSRHPDDSGERFRIELHDICRATIRGWCPHGTHVSTCKDRAIKRVLSAGERMSKMLQDTPEVPPQKVEVREQAERRADTLFELYSMRMAAWQRRYICMVPPPGHSRHR